MKRKASELDEGKLGGIKGIGNSSWLHGIKKQRRTNGVKLLPLPENPVPFSKRGLPRKTPRKQLADPKSRKAAADRRARLSYDSQEDIERDIYARPIIGDDPVPSPKVGLGRFRRPLLDPYARKAAADQRTASSLNYQRIYPVELRWGPIIRDDPAAIVGMSNTKMEIYGMDKGKGLRNVHYTISRDKTDSCEGRQSLLREFGKRRGFSIKEE